MEADVKSFIGFLAPLAIAYMTWSSVTSEVTTLRGPELKPINVGQLGTAPKLPSAEMELRDPFTPEGAVSAAIATAGAKGAPKEDLPLHLDGTVLAGKLRFAVINGTRVMEGDFFRGLKLERVEASRVVLTGGTQQTVLPLEIAPSSAIEMPAASPPAADTANERGDTAAPAGGTGGMGGMGASSRGGTKSAPVKKASSGGMGAKPAPKTGGGGMGH